jgi:hypothetical protein
MNLLISKWAIASQYAFPRQQLEKEENQARRLLNSEIQSKRSAPSPVRSLL